MRPRLGVNADGAPADAAADEDLLERPASVDEDGAERVRLKIRRKLPGRRLDKYLHGRFPRMSRTLIQRHIKQGAITVNGKPTKPSYEMNAGDLIDLIIPPPEPYEVIPEDIPLDVIYEDDFLLAINKSAGIICHPARATQTGTIANALAFYSSSLSHCGDPFRPGIVHRLDKNTTGVMIVAKTDEAHWRLARQFELRTTRKIYHAVVHGNVELDGDVIDMPIAGHPTVYDRFITSGIATKLGPKFERKLGKPAVTRYEVIERLGAFTLVHLYPKTGRTHQLRVHMSHIGHPVAGDPFYGGSYVTPALVSGSAEDSRTPIICRQALHAHRLIVEHPETNKPLELEAPLPDDMRQLIEFLRKHHQATVEARPPRSKWR
ncbi:MAG: RluA family pseudouridine synthase [Phycisphaerae bacterium]